MEQKLTYIEGYEKCPDWLKLVYRKSVDFCCQSCKRYEKDVGILSPHRLIRANKGGLYTVVPFNHKLNNVKVLCLKCHQKLHQGEFRSVHII